MSSENASTITGNLARDPELRFTPSGAAVVNFGVAVNRRWMNKQTNQWDEQVSFIDVVAWRDLAENVSESLTKGDRVTVVGRLEQRSWESSEGEKRSKVEIVADEVSVSLRWATAQVTKTERTSPSDAGGGSGGGAAKYNADEEPF